MSSRPRSRWLANTLLVLAGSLVLFGALWAILASRWSNALDQERESWSTRGWPTTRAELFPPIDSQDDAAPIYRVAVGKLYSWHKGKEREEAIDQAWLAIRAVWLHPAEWTEEQERALDVLDAPEFQDAVAALRVAARKQHYGLVDPLSPSGPDYTPGGLLENGDLLPLECMRKLRRGDRAGAWDLLESLLALSTHLRETPVLFALSVSDDYAQRALSVLQNLVESDQIEPARIEALLKWIGRIQPDHDLIRALDVERILFAGPAWDALRAGATPMNVWTPTDPTGILYSKVLLPWRLLDEGKYWELQGQRRAWLCAHPWDPEPSPKVSAVFPITRCMQGQSRIETPTNARRGRDLAEIALRVVQFRSTTGSYPPTLDALGTIPNEPRNQRSYSFSRVGAGFALGLPDGVSEGKPSGWPMHWSTVR